MLAHPNFSLRDYLFESKVDFLVHDSNGHDEYALNCPACIENGEPRADTKRRLWINTETGKFYCYNCTWAGQLTKFVQRISKTSLVGALRILKGKSSDLEILNYRLSNNVEFSYSEMEDDTLPLAETEFPHGFELFADNKKRKTIYHKYLDSRGVSMSYASEMDWGFCDVGYAQKRIIVPTYMNDKLVLWQARDILAESHPLYGKKDYKKVLNPKGVSKSKVLYNFDKAKESSEIIVCEGFFDAAKAGENAVAINGKTLHSAQVEALAQTKARSIILLLDPDAFTDERRYASGKLAGQVKKACSVEKARSMLASLYDVRIVRLPDGRDAGSYQQDELQSLIHSRKKMA